MHIAESAAGTPAIELDARFAGDLAKAAAALSIRLIVIEMTMAIAGHKKVGKAVVIIIADCHALAVTGMHNADLTGDIEEGAVALIAEETTGRRRGDLVSRWKGAALNQE
jgi:hypothetical protein